MEMGRQEGWGAHRGVFKRGSLHCHTKSPNQMSSLHPHTLFQHPRPGQTLRTRVSEEEKGM